MSRKAFKVWNNDRTIKKSFCCNADINELLTKAHDFGLQGRRLVLEEDGTEIEDNEILECFSDKTFIVLSDNTSWIAPNINTQEVSSENNLQYFLMHNTTAHSTSTLEPVASTSQATISIDDIFSSDYDSPSPSISDTLSMSSGALSTSSRESSNIGLTQSKILFNNFKIDWNNVPKRLTSLLENGEKCQGYLNDLIHLVISEMRTLSFYIPVPVMRQVALEIISKYPKSFSNETDLASLTSKLVYHNNYLNRSNKKREVQTILEPKIIKKVKSLQEGCPNWEIKRTEEEETLENKRLFLKMKYPIKYLNADELDKINKYFLDTFSEQRKFLNNVTSPPSIKEIQEQWPHLLTPSFAKKHFKILFSKDDINLILNLNRNIDAVINLSKTKKQSAFKHIKEESKEFTLLRFLVTYFEENLEHFVKKFPFGTDINTIDPIENSPWIAVLDTSPDTEMYYVYVEKVKCSSTNSLFEALEIAIIYFFNFNMLYPRNISLTLQALQSLMGLPQTFGRSAKKSIGNRSRVQNFLKLISV